MTHTEALTGVINKHKAAQNAVNCSVSHRSDYVEINVRGNTETFCFKHMNELLGKDYLKMKKKTASFMST